MSLPTAGLDDGDGVGFRHGIARICGDPKSI